MRAIRGLAAPLTALVLLTACVGAPQGEEQPVRRAWAGGAGRASGCGG